LAVQGKKKDGKSREEEGEEKRLLGQKIQGAGGESYYRGKARRKNARKESEGQTRGYKGRKKTINQKA